ncbi:Protein FAM26D [Pteropus alecto]|uniref:Protein FAM26D n=1 Tax=Pteropus alecto TaxID=9402 RepID=L5JRA9_PTEAL|nr:Protein FAM26D [Pteropus alecto]
MGPTLNSIVSSLQRSGIFINSLITALTIGGQQVFSSLMFRCPCQVGKNFYYGSAFLVIPALILLVAGYALRSQMWTITSEYCCRCAPPHRRISLLERKLACLRFFSITGRALVAPLTWLAATLMTGTYYECAASEFASVDHYPVFDNIGASKREEIVAGFPCFRSAPSYQEIRDEVALLHRYQSQQCYWTNHLHNERKLFEQAAEQHSRFIILQRIKKLFGFIPGKEDVKHIRIPSCQDWKDISVPSLFCMGDDLQGHYSFLGDQVDEHNEESKLGDIELKP